MLNNFVKTKAEHLQEILNDYRAEHQEQQDWTMQDAAAWAIKNYRWFPPFRDATRMCAAELSQAARVEYYEDPQGRRVRKKYARRETVMVDGTPKQLVFWEDVTNAHPDHMRVSFQQRRQAILMDNAQLKRDNGSYNDNNVHGAMIQLSFDYTEDLLELEAPEDYPNAPDQD